MYLENLFYCHMAGNVQNMKHARSQGPEAIKHFSCSIQMSMKFIILINIDK